MKKALAFSWLILFIASTYAQDVPLAAPVPPPPPSISSVSQFPIESDQWPNSPLMKNRPVDPMSSVVLPPVPEPLIQPPPQVLIVDTAWLKKSTPLTDNGIYYDDSTKSASGVTVLDLMSRTIVIDKQGKTIAKFPMGYANFLKDGTILGCIGSNLVKADVDMDVIWKTPAGIHHEVTVDENGAIYTLSNELHEYMGVQVGFDGFQLFSPDGRAIYNWCLYDHLENFISVISKSTSLRNLYLAYDSAKGAQAYIAQDPESFFYATSPRDSSCRFELTHFNSIQVLPENEVSKKIPAFKKGNLLLSFNPYSCYGIVDTGTGEIIWAGYLPERSRLHTPLLTPAGTILVFQNSTPANQWGITEPCLNFLNQKDKPQKPPKPAEAKMWVSIAEYDPITNNKVWEYTGTPKKSLQAESLGSAQRLPNGNTLVCIATNSSGIGGRVFELTPDKEICWSYVSPEVDPVLKFPFSFYRAKRISLDLAKKIIPGFQR